MSPLPLSSPKSPTPPEPPPPPTPPTSPSPRASRRPRVDLRAIAGGATVTLLVLALLAPRFDTAWAQPIGDPPVYLPIGLDGVAGEAAPAQATASPPPTTPQPTVSSVPPPPSTQPPPGTPTEPPVPGTPTPETAQPAPAPVVLLPGGIDIGAWFGDATTILDARIVGDDLLLSVRYGGGCVDHDFWLAASTLFMESQPPQVAMLLSHNAHNDLCRALITRDLAFDLRPLARSFAEGGADNGTLILRLPGWTGELRYTF